MHIIMELESAIINSKASTIFNNIEGVLISVCLKGLQNLIECSKIRSNGSLLNILRKRGQVTCQIKYFSIRIVEVIVPTLYRKKQK